jgi:hypothetical protein
MPTARAQSQTAGVLHKEAVQLEPTATHCEPLKTFSESCRYQPARRATTRQLITNVQARGSRP